MIILYDINPNMIAAWQEAFEGCDDVEIKETSFENLSAEYVVTAGNSYGWMTGGLDLAVRTYYGNEIQDKVQYHIINKYKGCMPVGEIACIKTGDYFKPNLIYAPTMDVPKQISVFDVIYVLGKILEQYWYEDIAICGLGTCTGRIDPWSAAKAYRFVYDIFKNGLK